MIQGYAIYLRTHRETGKQYAGAVWGSGSSWSPEKAATIRWKAEDRKGIRKLFGGFESKILLSERRDDAPTCSETLYRIRIAVDEDRAIMQIPSGLRLNIVSPLIHCHPLFANEETARANGRRMGAINGPKSNITNKKNGTGIYGLTQAQKIERGRKAGQTNLKSGFIQKLGQDSAKSGHIQRIGALARTPEHQRAAGLANVASGHIYRVNAALTFEDRSRSGKLGGTAAVASKRAKGIPIFPVEAQRKNGLQQGPVTGNRMVREKRGVFAQTPEQLQIAQILGRHVRWHISRGIVNPDCTLCSQKEESNG
jgi:hypothetical protein